MKTEFEKYDFDDELIAAVQRDRQPRIKVYRPEFTAVVLGRGSKADAEIDLEACMIDHIPVYKRSGGGCAVVVDPGNVIVSIVLPTEGIADNRKYFDKISQLLIAKLEEIGISGVYQDGISDLVVDSLKIGGSCIKRSKDYLYYSTTILVDPEMGLMDQYLSHPPREPGYRDGRSHENFLGMLSTFDDTITASKLAFYLTNVIKNKDLKSLI
jgi:lipoate-protein ligase A